MTARLLPSRNEVSKRGQCVHCLGQFRASTLRLSGRLCANCFKIHQSVALTASRHHGSFRMRVHRPGRVVLLLECERGHHWEAPFHSRRAKNWCRACKDETRVQAQREQLEEARVRREQLHRQQQLLLEQASLEHASSLPQATSERDELRAVLVQ